MKKISSRKFILYLTLTLLYAALIFYLSSQSHLPHTASQMEHLMQRILSIIGTHYFFIFKFITIHIDKLEHFVIYFVFGFLIRITLSHSENPFVLRNVILLTMIIGVGYGALDEVHQMFVPGRSPSIYDLFADAAGMIFSQIFIALGIYLHKSWHC